MDNSNNNNKSDNNNKDHNNNNEILFWKVIHNKYIFKYIMECIEIGEWCIYDEYKQIQEKLKFKYIDSFDMMLEEKQYSLLKCKIEADEYIEINDSDFDSFRNLLKLISTKKENEYRGDTRSIQQIENESIKSFEIYQLLFKHKLKELEDIKWLHQIVFQHGNLETIKILNQNIPIQCQHVTNLFSYTKLLDVELLFNEIISSLISTNEFKNNSIYYAFSSQNNEILEFILNNTQYYNVPTSTSTSSSLLQPNKRFKSSNDSNQEIKYYDKEDDEVNKLEAHDILYINSKQIRTKLLELNYFKEINEQIMVNKFQSKSSIWIERLKEIFHNGDDSKCYSALVNYSSRSDSAGDDDQEYLVKHDMPKEGMDIHTIYRYAMESFSANSFQYLISLNEITPIKDIISQNPPPKPININIESAHKRSNEEMVKLIEIYTNNHKLFNNSLDYHLYQYILSSKSKEQYDNLVNAITSTCNSNFLLQFLNKPWSPLVYSMDNVAKDKPSIDWLVENNYKYRNPYLNVHFNNIELLEYAIEKQYITNLDHVKHFVCIYLKEAILKFDIKLLISCQQLSNSFDNFGDIEHTPNVPYDLIVPADDSLTERIVELFNHLKSTNFKLLSKSWIEKFYEMTLSKLNEIHQNQQHQNKQSELPLLISNLNINFNQYLESSIDLFSEFTSNFSLIPFKLFLNNDFNPMKTHSSLFMDSWNKITINQRDKSYYHEVYGFDDGPINHQHKCLYYMNISGAGDDGPFYCTSNESPDSIITFIKSIINQFNIDKQVNTSNDDNGNNDGSYYNCISTVINFLLKKLIRSKYTSVVNVKYIRRYIINNFDQSFQFQHSTFQSYYYILLKSPRLLMFIMKLQQMVDSESGAIEFDGEDFGGYINYEPLLNDEDEEYDQLDFIRLIDPRIFTFEYLHGGESGSCNDGCNYGSNNGESFNNILENLIQRFVHSPTDKYPNLIDFNLVYNKTLEYLLEIKHYTLFFKQLNYINNKLSSNNSCNSDDCDDEIDNHRTFHYSKELILLGLKNLDSESFKSFIEISNYQYAKNSLTDSFGRKENRLYNGFEDKFINLHIETIKNVLNQYNMTL